MRGKAEKLCDLFYSSLIQEQFLLGFQAENKVDEYDFLHALQYEFHCLRL